MEIRRFSPLLPRPDSHLYWVLMISLGDVLDDYNDIIEGCVIGSRDSAEFSGNIGLVGHGAQDKNG